MRNRFEKANRFVSAVGVGIGVVVAHRTNDWLAAQDVSNPVLIVVAIGIVVLTSELLRLFFDHWLLDWSPIRWLVLGWHYVEGTWLDVMWKENAVLAIGITRIHADGQKIRITGDDFDPNGQFTGRYWTEILSIDWPRVRYLYHYHRSDASSPADPGFATIQFDERRGRPVRYKGDFFDRSDGKQVAFEGWRVKDRELRRELDERVQRSKAIRSFCFRVTGVENPAAKTQEE